MFKSCRGSRRNPAQTEVLQIRRGRPMMDGRTARGDYTDPIASVVRSLLDWTVQVEPW
jgi:hypothetical protein